jgi:carbon storage regulator
MLVLTRKTNEKIMIGDDIEILVVNVGEEKVQLGITAPRSIPVHRREVYDEIQRENLLASGSAVPSLDALCGLKIARPPGSPQPAGSARAPERRAGKGRRRGAA